MAKKSKSLKKEKEVLAKGDILTPLDVNKIGSNDDPCFGKEYDLSTDECKMCGDSELCCIKMANAMGKTRKELEEANHYKDLESLVDKKAIRKTIRSLRRKGEGRSSILDKIQAKYELSREDARSLYKEYKESIEDKM